MTNKNVQGYTSHLMFAVAAAALGSSFQHGYNTAVVNAPQKLVGDWISTTYNARYNSKPEIETIDLIYSVIVSIYSVGGMTGGLMTAYVSNKYGRKGGLLLNNLFVFVAALLMGLSKYSSSYEMLIAGRFFVGINAGLNAGVCPLYLNEISPLNLRGSVGTIYQVVLVVSILISNVFGLPQLLGTETLWPYLFSIVAIPAICQLAVLPFCPESPKHILVFQNKDTEAETVLSWLRGTADVREEMNAMRAEFEDQKLVPKTTLKEMWYNPLLRQPMIISSMIMISQQFSGINAAVFFSTQIFRGAGLGEKLALYSTLGMFVANFLTTLVSLVLIERTGRRTLYLTGLAGMAATSVVLAICLTFRRELPYLRFLSIAAVFIFVIFFATGPGSIPWFLVAELFGVGSRGLATSLAVAVNWIANFAIGLGFLPLTHVLGNSTFLVFTVMNVFFWIYTYRKVPETKGKSIEDVTAVFRRRMAK